MDSKDYRNLLLREIKEMTLLCESLTEVGEIPSGLLLLSKAKVESMAAIIDILSNESNKNSEMQTDDFQQVEKVEEPKSDIDIDTKKEVFVEEKSIEEPKDKVVLEEFEETIEEPLDSQVADEESVVAQEEKVTEEETPKEETRQEQIAEVEVPEVKIPVVEEPVVEESEVIETAVEEPKVEVAASAETKKGSVSERRFLKPLKISIGDRFLYIKLFDNDAKKMNKAVSDINKLNTYEEALDYLSQYQWDEENEGVSEFYKLLKAHFS